MSLTVSIAAPYTTQESGVVHGEPALLASPGCHQRKPNELLNLVLYNRDKEERIPREGTSIMERWDGQWDNSECACSHGKAQDGNGAVELKRDRPGSIWMLL